MSQQQQSQQPPQQPTQPNWLIALFVGAIIGGIVQVLVNHFDAIAAAIVGLFSQIHLPPLQGSPAFNVLNILSAISTVLSGSSAIILFWLYQMRKRDQKRRDRKTLESLRLMKEDVLQLKNGFQQMGEGNQLLKKYRQQLKERNQQLEERNKQLEELLAKQQRKKGKTV